MIFLLHQVRCGEKRNHENKNKQKMDSSFNQTYSINDSSKLLAQVKLAINPKFPHWVLFSNGTYIIIEDSAITDEASYCTEIMKEYGPVHAGSPAGDFSVTHLNKTDGWVVSGHYYGMYTYVNPEELEARNIKNPTDIEIGVFGRHKRELDGKDCKIIHVNK
jgi:hypothetical protein